MNRKAATCFIVAAGLFVAGLLLDRYDTQVMDVVNRIVGPDNYGTTQWILLIDSNVRMLITTTAAVLIGAGAVIQALAPSAAPPAPPPEIRVDTTA